MNEFRDDLQSKKLSRNILSKLKLIETGVDGQEYSDSKNFISAFLSAALIFKNNCLAFSASPTCHKIAPLKLRSGRHAKMSQ